MTPRLLLNIARSADQLQLARRAEKAGLDGVGFADSPRLFPDTFLSAQRVLAGTGLPFAGPCVIGLGLHHPSVVARSARTLEQYQPGRTFLVVGRGESSVANEGLQPPSHARYLRLLNEVRDRLGESGDPVPVLGAASGPRTIADTARELGGVLIDVGADPAVIGRALEAARAAAADVRCWLFLRAVVTPDAAAAAASAAPLVGSCAARLVRSPTWFGVHDADLERVTAVAAAHDYRKHGAADALGESRDPAAEALVAGKFLVTGSAGSVADVLRPLAGVGLDGVVLAGAVAGIDAHLEETAGAVRHGLQAEPFGTEEPT